MSDPINLISDWLKELLLGLGLEGSLVNFIMQAIGVIVVVTVGLVVVIFLIWLERKLAGRLQDRIGPNRAGPFGLLQPIADMIKIFTKEYTTPDGADIVTFNIAPVLAVVSVLLMWAVIPYSSTLVGTDINVGVLYIIAVGSFGILALLLAGWSSNNKYALLGAFRAVAQLVSYEVPMVLSLMLPVLLARTMGVSGIVDKQTTMFLVIAPVGALIFLISSMAEVGRAPFDLLEAESEIVAGYHTEYSGMKFGMFYVGEFLHQFTIGALFSTLFLGGWRGPGAEQLPILGLIYFYAKTFFVYVIITWIRMTVPRIRIDQMLSFNWKFLTPLSLVVLIVTAILDKSLEMAGFRGKDQFDFVYIVVMFLANVIIVWLTVQLLKRTTTSVQREEFEPRPVAVAPKVSDSNTV